MKANPSTDDLVLELAQRVAIEKLARSYVEVRDQTLTAQDQEHVATLIAKAVRNIDPKRCRARVVLAVQDPDPATLAEGKRADENLQHTVMASGYQFLVTALLEERHVSMVIANRQRLNGEEAMDQMTSTLAGMDLGPTDVRSAKEH